MKLCLLLLFMVLGCFAITNVRTTTVQASSRTFKSNGRTYMEKHNDNTLKYDREPFTVEVGNTEDIDKIADILRELGDHYLEEDVASIPLSLTAYMKVTFFNPVVYEVCYMDKENRGQ